MMDGYWRVVAEKGRDANPYRAGFLQLVVVAENDARAEEIRAARRVLLSKCLVPAMWFSPRATRTTGARRVDEQSGAAAESEERYRDFVEKGSSSRAAAVRDRLKRSDQEPARRDLMVLLQIGSMPHELALGSIELFGREVLGPSRHLGRRGWVNHWWPERLRQRGADAGWCRGGRHMASASKRPPRPVDERIITVWQGGFACASSRRDADPLVFFHGPWGLTWDPFLDQLAESFTVYAPDHPGRRPRRTTTSTTRRALGPRALLRRALETLGIRNAAFVGHSFGGMVACEVARRIPIAFGAWR
jgi:hypothetical protein